MATGHNGTDALLDVKAVAERLGISVNTIYKAVQDGELKSHRFGRGRGTIRITEADLALYMDACCSECDEVESEDYFQLGT